MPDRSVTWWKQALGMEPQRPLKKPDTVRSRPEPPEPAPARIAEPDTGEYKTTGGGLPKGFRLTEEFEAAFHVLEHGPQIVFLTGRAGTGKSTLLQFFRLNTKKEVAVVAPTGVAALNVQGQTIHSFFRFPPHPVASSDIKKVKDARLYRAIDTLVIDEISMVRADLLDGIDRFMRLNGNHKTLPFGGARVVMIGDPYQLPPVVATKEERTFLAANYASPYFFSANALFGADVKTIDLQENFRQKEREFMEILDRIRMKRDLHGALRTLNERCLLARGEEPAEGSVVLTSTNRRADAINAARLDALDTEAVCFESQPEGDFSSASRSRYPAPERLWLKRGAQVMFLRNDFDQAVVNGTMGRITALSDSRIVVEVTDSGKRRSVEVEPSTWESYKYAYDASSQRIEAGVVGSYTQYPLMLAWATTIHKSQGKTFDRVTLDLTDRAFAHGQVYVALSRCRTLEGLSLRVPVRTSDVQVDEAVGSFFWDDGA